MRAAMRFRSFLSTQMTLAAVTALSPQRAVPSLRKTLGPVGLLGGSAPVFSAARRGLSSTRLSSSEEVFFTDAHTFADLGVCGEVQVALREAGIVTPSRTQAEAIPPRLEDGSGTIIVGAETGSGKTLAYVIPLLHQLMQGGGVAGDRTFPFAVVLVATRELAHQAVQMTKAVAEHLDGVSVGSLMGQQMEWPFRGGYRDCPHILVTTPTTIRPFSNGKIELFRGLRHLVIDEADLLLDGSYERQTDQVLTAVRRVQREGLPLELTLAAATLPSRGLGSVEAVLQKRFPDALRIGTRYQHKQHPNIQARWVEAPASLPARTGLLLALLQHGADGGSKSLCNGENLRSALERLGEEVTVEGASAMLQSLGVPEIADSAAGGSVGNVTPTLVFLNTAEACAAVAGVLQKAGVKALGFHKKVGLEARQLALDDFRSGACQVLVCTDMAARGIDLPNVQRVVQLQFALNVVQHLHRQGRAARAGREGQAFNFWDREQLELVSEIRKVEDRGERIDEVFSRKRGFKKRLKKAKRAAEDEEGTPTSRW